MTMQGRLLADEDFRDSLRRATAGSHERLDAIIRHLDLSAPEGRASLSRIHLAAYERLGRACHWDAGDATDLLIRLRDRLYRELGPSAVDTRYDRSLHPDSVAYVMLGSQLGLTVLRKALAPEARSGIFANDPDISTWKSFLLRLKNDPPQGTERQRILFDAVHAFTIFQSETERELHRPGTTAA